MLGINRIIIAWSLRIIAATGFANNYGHVIKSSSNLQDQIRGGSILLQSFSHVQVLKEVGDRVETEPIHQNTSTRTKMGDLESATEARGWAFAQEVRVSAEQQKWQKEPQQKELKKKNGSTMGDALQAPLKNQTSLFAMEARKEHVEPQQKEAQKMKNASTMGDVFQALLKNETLLVPGKASKEYAEPLQKEIQKAKKASTMDDAFQALLNNQTSLIPRKAGKERAKPMQNEAEKTKNASTMGDAFQALLNNQTSLISREAGKGRAEPPQEKFQKTKNASTHGDAFQAAQNRYSVVTRNVSSAQPPPGQISLHSEETQKAATPPSNKTSFVNHGNKTSAPPKALSTNNTSMFLSSMKSFISESCAEFREGSRQWASLLLFLFTGMTHGFGHLAEISADYPFGMSAIGMLLLLGFALLKEIRELKASNAELINRCLGRPLQLDSRWLSRFYASSLSRSAVPWQSDQLTEAVGGRE